MFKTFSLNDFEGIEARDFFRANSFLSMTPKKWSSNFANNWTDLFSRFQLHLESFLVSPVGIIIPEIFEDGSNFCFYIDEIECFFHVPSNSIDTLKKHLDFSVDKPQMALFSSVAGEYFVRKMLSDIQNNWIGERAFNARFVGLDTQVNFEKFEFEVVEFNCKINGTNLIFYLLLPDWIIDQLEIQFPKSSLINTSFEHLDNKFLLSFEICSKLIPTSTLIEILRKDSIIDLAISSVNEQMKVTVNNLQDIDSRLWRLEDVIVVEFLKESEDQAKIIKREESLLSISLGSSFYDIDILKEFPRIIEVADANFPEIDIMISGEIVSKGILGILEETGTLAVKVI